MNKKRQTASTSEIGRLTGLNRATVQKHLSVLSPVTVKGGQNATLYFLDESIGVLVRVYRAQAGEGPKNRKLEAEARKVELIVAKIEGTLVPINAMKASAVELIKTLHQRCVMLAPKLVANKLAGKAHEPLEIEITVREEIAEVFEELRSAPSRFMPLAAAEAEEQTKETQEETD